MQNCRFGIKYRLCFTTFKSILGVFLFSILKVLVEIKQVMMRLKDLSEFLALD